MSRAVLALGSNLGDREEHLRTAIEVLGDTVLVVSGVYETPPWGDSDQPEYLNAVVLVAGAEDEYGWLARARAAEAAAGRTRDPDRPFGPRTLDVDVIAVWTDAGEPIVSSDPELTLPHPRAHLRAFVLRPWLDIAPYAQLPGRGSVNELMFTAQIQSELPELRPRPDVDLAADRG